MPSMRPRAPSKNEEMTALVAGVVLLVQGVGGITKCTKDIFGNIEVGNETRRARPRQHMRIFN